MSYAGIARAIVFYLFVAFVVFYLSPTGPYFSYPILVLASLLFVLIADVRVRPGNPLPGSIVGLLAISAIFALMLAIGSVTVTGTSSGLAAILASGVVLQVLVACGEEMAFRGYILGDLRSDLSPRAAIILSSVGFGLLHMHSMSLLGVSPASAAIGLTTITAAGALLGIICLRWGLLSAIGFHFFWNFLQYDIFGLGRQGEFPSLVNLSRTGNLLLTGGEYGPEASLPGLAVVLITLGVVWYYFYMHKTDKSNPHEG